MANADDNAIEPVALPAPERPFDTAREMRAVRATCESSARRLAKLTGRYSYVTRCRLYPEDK